MHTIHHGDCLDVLRSMPDNSVHAIVTDPPYGLSNTTPEQVAETIVKWVSGEREYLPSGRGFMGKEWDGFVPPVAVWDEAMRVLKPGGHVLSFAGTRTMDLMTLGLRLAGFEIRDSVAWLYGSGFPKSQNVGKAIDKRGGADISWFGPWLRVERRKRGISSNQLAEHFPSKTGGMTGCVSNWELGLNLPTPGQFNTLCRVLDLPFDRIAEAEREITQHAAREAVAGKTITFDQRSSKERERRDIPATDAAKQWEGWGSATKPAHEPIVMARKPFKGTLAANVLKHGTGAINVDATRVGGESGRWPANVILDEHMAGVLDGQSGELHSQDPATRSARRGSSHFGSNQNDNTRSTAYADKGGASRFFYVAKAPKRERPDVDGIKHPTVKPLALMRWLVRLVTPPGGTVLDPFAGSGTTIEAAMLEGFDAIGIEREAEYLPLIQHRIDRAQTAQTEAPEQGAFAFKEPA